MSLISANFTYGIDDGNELLEGETRKANQTYKQGRKISKLYMQ